MTQSNATGLKRGIVHLVLWLVFVIAAVPRVRSFIDTGAVNFMGRTWDGNAALIVVVALVLVSVVLLALGLKGLHSHFTGSGAAGRGC